MATGFRGNIFDPVLVVTQIGAMQCCFYVTLGLWLWLAATLGDVQVSLDQMFDYHVSSLLSYMHIFQLVFGQFQPTNQLRIRVYRASDP